MDIPGVGRTVVFINSLTCEFPNRVLCRGAYGLDYDSVTATYTRVGSSIR
jgi:hypothetical protein